MSGTISIRFESRLRAPPERVWQWITSFKGITAEMRPVLRMTAPRNIRSLADVQIQPGVPMFRSYILLFGFLPIDYSDMTLLEFTPGTGFIEQSSMASMRLWRHERHIAPCTEDLDVILLVDQLTFEPRIMKSLVGWFIRRFFVHRHKVLRANLSGALHDEAPDKSATSK